MAARKKRPDARRQLNADAGANLVAWLILATGVVVFALQIHRHATTPESVEQALPLPPTPPDADPTPTSSPIPPPPRRERADPPAPAKTPDLAARDLLRDRPAKTPRERSRRIRGRLAIIIDDIGQDLTAARRASEIRYALTFAVIPHLPHSRGAAELLHAKGYELILHLPMEPLGYPQQDPGQGAILSRMADAEIRRTVLADLAAVPYIRGVNNHMGSRITSDPGRMRAVLSTLAGTPYFFVDSRTTDSSVALRVARELSIPSAERSVFLDDTIERAAIAAEIHRAFRIARERGTAIAIGHPHPLTLSVLSDELPALAADDIEIVSVSELVS